MEFISVIFDEFVFFSNFLFRVIWEENSMKKKFSKVIDNNVTEPSSSIEIDSTDETDSVMHERESLIFAYAAIMAIGNIFYLLRSFLFFRMCLQISINFHDMIFRGISRAKMIFFNNNPSGRILNRFAKDINNIDSLLPTFMIRVLEVNVKFISKFR